MLYPELFKQLEAVRWSMDTDIPWDRFDATQLTDEQIAAIVQLLANEGHLVVTGTKVAYAALGDA